MSVLKLEPSEARQIVYEDHEDWKRVTEKDMLDKTRWSICFGCVFLHIPTEKNYYFVWSCGATEMQDEDPYEYETSPIEVEEVFLKEVTTKRWVNENNNIIS